MIAFSLLGSFAFAVFAFAFGAFFAFALAFASSIFALAFEAHVVHLLGGRIDLLVPLLPIFYGP